LDANGRLRDVSLALGRGSAPAVVAVSFCSAVGNARERKESDKRTRLYIS